MIDFSNAGGLRLPAPLRAVHMALCWPERIIERERERETSAIERLVMPRMTSTCHENPMSAKGKRTAECPVAATAIHPKNSMMCRTLSNFHRRVQPPVLTE